jgi:hypothetical protein
MLLSYQASKLKPINKTVSIAALYQINWYKAKLLKTELIPILYEAALNKASRIKS